MPLSELSTLDTSKGKSPGTETQQQLSPAFFRVRKVEDGEDHQKVDLSTPQSESGTRLPTVASRFVPKPGASIEYLLTFRIKLLAEEKLETGTPQKLEFVASYPEPSVDHSKLDFDEKCKTICNFLFPYQTKYISSSELDTAEKNGIPCGTPEKPYSFMFVGTDSDYSKFYAHCCVVHVPVQQIKGQEESVLEPLVFVAMTIQPTHNSLRKILESIVHGNSVSELLQFFGPVAEEKLQNAYHKFVPTIRRPHSFAWVVSERDIRAIRSQQQSVTISRVDKLHQYKCLLSSHRIDTHKNENAFAGPVLHLDAVLECFARELLQDKRRKTLTIHNITRDHGTADDHMKSVLNEQVRLECTIYAPVHSLIF